MNEYSSKLIQVWGEYLGCGKTALAALYAKIEHDLFNRPVYSNIHLSFSPSGYKPEPGEIVLMRRYRNAILVIDELYQILEARGSEKGKNLGLTREISMNRKRGNTIYGTFPEITQVDKRFRNLADFTIQTERDGPLNDRTALIKAYIFAKNMKNTTGLEMAEDWFEVSEICDYYDTREEVQSDRLAYIDGIVDLIKTRKDRKGNLILDKIKKSKLNLQKAYLGAVFYITSTDDKLLILDQLGLL